MRVLPLENPTVADLLYGWRTARQWTQAQTAVALNVSVPTYQRWETGTGLPPAYRLSDLIKRTKLPIEVVWQAWMQSHTPLEDDAAEGGKA